MIYLQENGKQYHLSYQELKEDYARFLRMSDAEFLQNLLHAMHFACVVSYLKELPAEGLVSDQGLLHEMIHVLLFGVDSPDVDLTALRAQFEELLILI